MRGSIYLVGFMGAGKTSVGRRLAELLDLPFFDLDQEIEKREGMPVSGIFAGHGEAHFRALERQELLRVQAGGRSVIAVGGGAYCIPENREAMEADGITVWLDVPLELLYARCSENPELRPLFAGREEMAQLLERRRPFYARARLHIQTGNTSVEEIARRVVAGLAGACY